MRKVIILFVSSVILLILCDTLQALIFDNSPMLKFRANYDGGSIHYIDKGIFVNTYKCVDGKKETVLKGKKYICLIK